MSAFPSKWLYEPLPGYQEPELAPLPPLDDPEELRRMRVRPSPLGKAIIRWSWKLSGFWRFYHQLRPENLEYMLRTTNLRTPGLFAPVISATILLHPSQNPNVDWLDRATALLLAAWQFKNDIANGKVPQDFWKGKPLEMGQYANLFGSILDVGQQPVNLEKNPQARDVLVLVNGNFFRIPLVEDFSELKQSLVACVAAGSQHPGSIAQSPGWLTAAENRLQLQYWPRLLKHPANKEIFEKIKNTFITLCLDSNEDITNEQAAAQWIHIGNPGNRFYLVGTQLVVLRSGQAGAIMNFTANIDGNPMSRFAEEVYRRSEAYLTEKTAIAVSETPAVSPEQLTWQIPQRVLNRAQRQVHAVMDWQPHTFVLEGLGKAAWGPARKDAVPWFVVGLMLTGYQLTGAIPVVEQFVSLAHFCCMGVTRQVVTSPECERAIQLLEQQPDSRECWQALQQCVALQKHRVQQARRHLPLTTLEGLYVRRMGRIRRFRFLLLMRFRRFVLNLIGNGLKLPTDLLISHPRIASAYTIIGRPGVRLPYVRQYGLHYQIHEDKTVLIFMPGQHWRYPNTLIVEKLKHNLQLLTQLVNQHHPKTSTEDELHPPAASHHPTK